MYQPYIDGLLLYSNFKRKGNVLILKFVHVIITCSRTLRMMHKYILTLLDLCQFEIINNICYRDIPGDLPAYFLVPALVFTWACILY